MSATNSFRYVEYTGPDAADVLVTLIMNLAHTPSPDNVHEVESDTDTPKVMGFQPNPRQTDENEEEDADE